MSTGSSDRSIEHPSLDAIGLQEVLEALVDPIRRAVVVQLATVGQDMSCGAFDSPVARSTMTHHFNVLREAGIIRQYYVGTTKMNSLRTSDMEHRFPGLLTSVALSHSVPPERSQR